MRLRRACEGGSLVIRKEGFAGNLTWYPLVIGNFTDSKSFPFFFFHHGKHHQPTNAAGDLGSIPGLPPDERPL